MKQTISKGQFRDAFQNMGRGEQFSYEALGALFDWLEEMEDCSDNEQELDVIALCCDFTEYANLEEFQADYGEDYTDMADIEETTIVIHVAGESFIIQQF